MNELLSIAERADPAELETLPQRYEWARAMAECPQDPRYHAEGDVWTHTRMVCSELVRLPDWERFDPARRRLLYLSAILHDVGKPATTRIEDDGRITSIGHARDGAPMAMEILAGGLPEPDVVHVGALVRHHMQPRYIPRKGHPEEKTRDLAEGLDCRMLIALARADTLGRISQEYEASLRAIDQFEAICDRLGLWRD